MLVGAGEKLGKVLENVEIHKPVIPYAANVTAQYVTEAQPVKRPFSKTGFFFRKMAAVCGNYAGRRRRYFH